MSHCPFLRTRDVLDLCGIPVLDGVTWLTCTCHAAKRHVWGWTYLCGINFHLDERHLLSLSHIKFLAMSPLFFMWHLINCKLKTTILGAKKTNKWGANIIIFLKYKGGIDMSLNKKTKLQFLETGFQTPLFF
jgi:hypothetical protein